MSKRSKRKAKARARKLEEHILAKTLAYGLLCDRGATHHLLHDQVGLLNLQALTQAFSSSMSKLSSFTTFRRIKVRLYIPLGNYYYRTTANRLMYILDERSLERVYSIVHDYAEIAPHLRIHAS